MSPTTIVLIAGHKKSGEVVHEEVLVTALGGGLYKVLATPGLVLGVAKYDVLSWRPDDRVHTVVKRGGFASLQIYGPHHLAFELFEDVTILGGFLDSRARDLTVYSIPVLVGLPTIEKLAFDLEAEHQEIEWYFGNVFDDDGTTPLNWWM